MPGKYTKIIIFLIVLILFFSNIANFSLEFSGEARELQNTGPSSRKVIGPRQLLKNSDFSQISDWWMINAIRGPDTIIWAHYDNSSVPSFAQFNQLNPITNLPFTYNAYLKQNFTKTIWTPNVPSAVVCKFQYNMMAYTGDISGNPVIDAEIFIEIKNKTSGAIGTWDVAAGSNNKFITDDAAYPPGSRMKIPQHPIINVGQDQGTTFSIRPPGTYELSILFKLNTIYNSGFVMFMLDLRIDDVYLYINDTTEPLIIAEPPVFGPYNSDPINKINVDFFSGGFENTILKRGKYRLNNSGTPGFWHTIFRNHQAFTQNWSITPIWNNLAEGENLIDIYCIDDLGNYNDSVQITVIKDTIPPSSNVLTLNEYYTTKEFNISYTASDPAPSGGFNNTVELWFRYDRTGDYIRYESPWQQNGIFNKSPILFNILDAGIGYGEGKYEFYTRGKDNATNYELPPALPYSTTLDNIPPNPVIIAPTKSHIKETEIVTVESDRDTEYMEFYYWLDKNNNGLVDNGDKGSSWVLIDNISTDSLEPPVYWSTNWNTLSYSDFIIEEQMVVLKAVAVDRAGNFGEAQKGGIEVDNIAPVVNITYPISETNLNMDYIVIEYKTDKDVNSTNFYAKENSTQHWRVIALSVPHEYGNSFGSYRFKLLDFFSEEQLILDLKMEVIDDTENIGKDEVFSVNIGRINDSTSPTQFPSYIELGEDFGKWSENFTEFESYLVNNIARNEFEWFVTGNSEEIFYITSETIMGAYVDTFTFISLPDRCGEEILTFHANGQLGYELTFEQTVVVKSINDRPGPTFITSPKEKERIKQGQKIYFTGTSYDPDIQYGDKLSYKWYSDISGELGTGWALYDKILPVGNHLITLEVLDNASEKSSTTVNITIYKKTDPEENDKYRTIEDNFIPIILISVIIIVIIIIIGMFLVFKKRKKGEKSSSIPIQTVKTKTPSHGNNIPPPLSKMAIPVAKHIPQKLDKPTLPLHKTEIESVNSKVNAVYWQNNDRGIGFSPTQPKDPS